MTGTLSAADQAVSRPLGHAGLVATFGEIAPFINGDGTVSEAWPRMILVPVELPYPLPLSWDMGTKVTKIRCHQRIAANFAQAFHAIDEADLWDEVKDFGGCYNFRTQRGSGHLSTHCWGISIDLSVRDNPLGATPKMHMGVIECFEAAGFYWGGRFHRPDGQHFQFCEGY